MSLNDTIQQIDTLKAELDALRPIKPEWEARIRQKFRLDWTYHSNSIEGNSLTYGETMNLIMHGISAPKPSRDNREIEEHNKLLKEFEAAKDVTTFFTEHTIREFHKRILGNEPYRAPALTQDGQETKRLITPGQYKTLPNNVQTSTGEPFFFTSPSDTPPAMQALIKWINEEFNTPTLDPLRLAATLHYKFIMIHPFDDGNGRMARILMNIVMQHYNLPPVIVLTTEKEQYFAALRKADAGDLDSFIDYVGSLLIKSLELNIKGAKGERIDEEDDADKKIELARRKLLSDRKKEEESESSLIKRRVLIIERSFLPVASTIDQKLSKFDSDFEEGYNLIEIASAKNVSIKHWTIPKKSLATRLHAVLGDLLTFLATLDTIPGVIYYVTHFRGKNTLLSTPQDLSVQFGIDFKENTYELRTHVAGQILPLITKQNDEYLTKEEVSEIVTTIIDTFLNALQR